MEKPFPNEAKFTAWFGKKIHDAWWMRFKLSDMDISLKPCDAVIALNWIVGLCEIKVGNEKNKVDVFKKLRPNQAFGLRRYKKNWWLSIVVYYSKLYHKYRVMEFEEEMLVLLSEQKW
jgi:hypothetical protein